MTIPVFGKPTPDADLRPRHAAYAVIFDKAGRVLVVRGPSGCFLPGGGSEDDETPEETIRREAIEELGTEVHLLDRVGEAVQYFHAEGVWWRMEAVFYEAELTAQPSETVEWLPVERMEPDMYHACHAWAVRTVEERR